MNAEPIQAVRALLELLRVTRVSSNWARVDTSDTDAAYAIMTALEDGMCSVTLRRLMMSRPLF